MIVKTPLFSRTIKKLVKIAGNLRQENQRQTHWATAHCKLYLIWRERRWLVAHTHMQVLGKLRQIQETCHNILEIHCKFLRN